MNREDINRGLERLVGGRFTEKTLNDKLSQMFNCDAKVSEYQREECVRRELPNLDEQLIVAIENDFIKIDVDLFYLKDKANNFYITETCFNYW